jgi:serine/threonine protein kinase
MHTTGFMHRDIKPSNIFIFSNGVVKLGDFSISRSMEVPPEHFNRHENGPLTPNITTRYYRAPEIIYGSRSYDMKVDIWSLGCTIAEIILKEPLFPGTTDINQLEIIFRMLGSPVIIL